MGKSKIFVLETMPTAVFIKMGRFTIRQLWRGVFRRIFVTFPITVRRLI